VLSDTYVYFSGNNEENYEKSAVALNQAPLECSQKFGHILQVSISHLFPGLPSGLFPSYFPT
jgi:hypothetical protein